MAIVKSDMLALGNRHSSKFVSLYVGDLSPDVTEEDLFQKFSFIVPVVSVISKSLSYSCLHIISSSFVAKFINKKERTAMTGNQEFTNVYLKNLLKSITEDTLHTVFSRYGTVSSVVVMRDGMGRSGGFGFVNFCHPENAKKAVESLNGQPLGSKNLFVGRALRKDERREMLKQTSRYMEWSNLYVKNLSESIEETKLRKIFGSYGQIVSAKVMRHENGKSKGFGFVCFSNVEESKQAEKELNGFTVDAKSLVVRIAECKADQHKRLQKHFRGQPSYYMHAPPVHSPAQPVLSCVPSSYAYCLQPYIRAPYYYMNTQLPQMFGHQNITTYDPAGQIPLKEKTSVDIFYNYRAYPFAKCAAKQ